MTADHDADTEETRVDWYEWGPRPFAVADRTGKPVVVFLTATWCDDCHEMAVETFGEPRIAANVNDGFVPIRVDVDRRPRVRERYNVGGFPSTVFCTPEGEFMTGATYLGPDGFRGILDRVRETWDAEGTDAGRVPRALAGADTPAGELHRGIARHFAGQLDEQWDPEFAGWGTAAKFPLPETIQFALKRDRVKATQTLDAIRQSLEAPDGGFYRYAGARDWSDPHRERLLVDNAGLLRAFAHGYLYTGDESYRETATDAAAFLRSELRVGDGFGGSLGPSGDRRDLTAYADGNALAAEALLWLAAYTDDETVRQDARGALRLLRSRLVDTETGRVVHFEPDGEDEADVTGHDSEGDTTGHGSEGDDDTATHPADILDDAARVVSAFTTAAQVLGEGTSLAQTVADRVIDRLGDEAGFRDGPATGAGLLDEPLRPIDGTVALADGLLDLAVLTGEERYHERAERALGAFAGATDRMGAQVAGYGAAVDRCLGEPLVVAVGDAVGSDLHRAALRIADHEKVVVPEATDAPEGTAVVRGSDATPAETPSELMDVVAETQ